METINFEDLKKSIYEKLKHFITIDSTFRNFFNKICNMTDESLIENVKLFDESNVELKEHLFLSILMRERFLLKIGKPRIETGNSIKTYIDILRLYDDSDNINFINELINYANGDLDAEHIENQG